MQSGQISQKLVCAIDEVGNAAAKINYHTLLVELNQEELENCKLVLFVLD